MVLRPVANRLERFDQSAPQGCEGVLDVRRYDGMDLACDEAVKLQASEGLGQHLLGHAADPPLQFSVAKSLFRERSDHESGPSIGDSVEDLP